MNRVNWNEMGPFFRRSEFVEPDAMSPALARRLLRMRKIYGRSIIITGSRRKRKGPRRRSAHEKNKDGFWEALDLKVRGGRQRAEIHDAAKKAGFRRIGVYDRHIHVDVATAKQFAQNVLWVGKSR